MEQKSKAETFVGFSIRARKYRSGLNTVSTVKKAYLLLISKTASENSVKEAKKQAERLRVKILMPYKPLEEITHLDGVKVMAITDEGLAKSIIDNSADEFKLLQ